MPVVAPLAEAGAGAVEAEGAGAAGEGAGGAPKGGGNPLHKMSGLKPSAPKIPEIPIPGFSEGHVGGLSSYLNPAQFH